MHRTMVICNEVQTQVITKGRWIEEDPLPDSSKHIILVIPGNPGIPQFYEDFIQAISAELPPDTPVWIIGHAGHVQPPRDMDIAMPSSTNWDKYYGLTAQTQHKVEFIKKYVPEDAHLHIIGHSIGAWFALNLLKNDDVVKRAKKCYLLFPTVENMAETINGRYFSNIISRFVGLWIFLARLFTTMFPNFLQVLFIRIFGLLYGISPHQIGIIQILLNPKALYRIIMLAKDEMKFVREADHETIATYADRLWFYYGAKDGWVPVKYFKNMITKHPDLTAQLCQQGFQHSFVLKNSFQMGSIVGKLINEHIVES